MSIFAKKAPQDPFAFAEKYTDQAFIELFKAGESLREQIMIALEYHRPIISEAGQVLKRMGFTALASLAVMSPAEREQYLKNIAEKSPQLKRLVALYEQAIGMGPYRCPECQSPFPDHDCLGSVS